MIEIRSGRGRVASFEYVAPDVKAERFTPGPWYIERKSIIGPRIESDDQSDGFIDEVCDCSHSIGDKEANAHLISSAPDLYDALDNLAAIMETDERSYVVDAVRSARAALAKARGES